MASYKVPQDVEAEDKLIGPFSFRQFVYLGIVAMALGAAWGLSLIFIPLAVIPLPIVIFFGALALPLRKDQPMETYLAAMVQFYLKPRRRMWMADGVVSRITIDIPQVVERRLTKSLTNSQAISQFDYLAQVADTGGWSTRGVMHAPIAVVDNPEEDILDGTSSVAQNFNTRLQQQDTSRHEELLAKIQSGSIVNEAPTQVAVQTFLQPQYQVQTPPPIQPLPAQAYVTPAPVYSVPEDDMLPTPVYNPAPQYMQQHVIQPVGAENHKLPTLPQNPRSQNQSSVPENQSNQSVQNTPEPSASVATPAIMELAKGVSVETVAKQLHHDEIERASDGEVLINLH